MLGRDMAWGAGLTLAVLCAASAAAGRAEAQPVDTRTGPANGAGIDTHLFRSALDATGFFSVNGAEVLPANNIHFGFVADYGYNLMPLASGHSADQMIKNSLQGTLLFNYGLLNWLNLGASIPVTLSQSDPVTDVGPTGHTYDVKSFYTQGISYVALHAKLKIIRPRDDQPGVGLAAMLQGGIAALGADTFTAEPKGFIWPQGIFEARMGPRGLWRVDVNAGFRAHFGEPTKLELGADGKPQLKRGVFEYGQLVTASVGTGVHVLPPLEIAAETYGTYMVGGESAEAQRFSAEVIAGIKLFIDKRSYLFIGGGPGYAPGFQTATARGTVGFMYEPTVGDRDHDGIPDNEDACPDEPGVRSADPRKNGCPILDKDGDGVLDADDDCPDKPGPKWNHGCPVLEDGDRDHDGVLDSVDQCPDTPGLAKYHGCPPPDRDHDGVPDDEDQCPDTPGPASNRGCPPPTEDKRIIVTDNSILILDKIQFETGSAKILAASNSILDAVATTLKDHAEFTLVEVEGHADQRGSDALNLQLTKARAKSVSDALAQRGIAEARLRSQGYGSYCPLDDANNDAAWEKNRRVEFKIMRTNDKPTGATLGCPKAEEKGIRPQP